MTKEISEKFDFSNLEKDLMSAFLQDRKMWVDFKDHIEENYFNKKEVSMAFKIFRVFFNKYKDYPTKKQAMVLARRKGCDQKILKTIEDIYMRGELKLSEINFLREETGKFIKDSKTERAIIKSVDLLEGGHYTQIRNLITDAVHWDPEVNLGTNYADAEKRFASLQELMINIVASPWERLNYFLGGGFYRKELYLFAASSSVGKSIALDQIALHAWDKLGLNVVLLTFEMSEERKGQRMDACKFGIPVNKVMGKKNMIIKSFENNKKKNKLFIKEFPTKSTMNEVDQYIYQLKLYEDIDKIGLLVSDYMDIMSPIKKTGKQYEDQGQVGMELRDYAKSENLPAVSASQFNRDALEMTIQQLNEGKIADSWKKMMVADGLVAMANSPEERQNGIINFKGLKNRNGQKDFILPFRIIYEQLKIIDHKSEDSKKAKKIIDERKKAK